MMGPVGSGIPRIHQRRLRSSIPAASKSSQLPERRSLPQPPRRTSSSLPIPATKTTLSKIIRKPSLSKDGVTTKSRSAALLPPRPASRASSGSSNKSATTAKTTQSQVSLHTPTLTPETGAPSQDWIPETPSAPQRQGNQTAISQRGRTEPSPPFVGEHVSDPCIKGALIHQLNPCGHKVITKGVTSCASNCLREYKKEVAQFANTSITEKPFVCAACVELHLKQHRESRKEAERARFDKTSRRMGEDFLPQATKDKMFEYFDSILKNDLEKERKMFESLGRPCCLIPGEALYEQPKRQTPVDTTQRWPPAHRPKEAKGEATDLGGMSFRFAIERMRAKESE